MAKDMSLKNAVIGSSILAASACLAGLPCIAAEDAESSSRPRQIRTQPYSHQHQQPRRPDAYRWLSGLKVLAVISKNDLKEILPVAKRILEPEGISIVSFAEAKDKKLPVLELTIWSHRMDQKLTNAGVELELTEFVETKRQPPVMGRCTTWRVAGSRMIFAGKNGSELSDAEEIARNQAVTDVFQTFAKDVDDARIVEAKSRKFEIPDYLDSGIDKTPPLSKSSPIQTDSGSKGP